MHIDVNKELHSILPLVRRPSRYIGAERNLAGKDPSTVAVTVALSFPEVYEIGMSHLGIKMLYHIINSRDDSLADRVFAPWVDMELQMRRKALPLWGLETGMPLKLFDIVGFSLMHELMYTNVLTMLDLGKIPIRSSNRDLNDPLVIGGGPCASNPEPLAPFFDAFVIGEGEDVVGEIIACIGKAKRHDSCREERLRELSSINGVYVPSLYTPSYGPSGEYEGLKPVGANLPPRIKKRFPGELREAAYASKPIVPLSRVVQDRLDVELFRGCTRGCRFCHAGFFYRPVRENSIEAVRSRIASGISSGGWEEIGLLSLSSSDYTNIEGLLDGLRDELVEKRISCSLPSLRVDNFSLSLAEMISGIKRTGLTFAPEAGTDRLRRVINKQIDRDKILETARAAYEKGWQLIKCYFMVGLPTETSEDIDGIVDLALAIHNVARQVSRRNRLNVSVGIFVPKPHTPFQWEAFGNGLELKDRISNIRRRLNRKGIRVKWHSVASSSLEAFLARGDRRTAEVVFEAWSLGCRFDEWTEQFNPSKWEEAMTSCGVAPEAYLAERGESQILPWDHIDLQVRKHYLLRERHLASQAQTTDDCRWGGCHGCGISGAPDDNVLRPNLQERAPSRGLAPAPPSQMQSADFRWRLVFQKKGAIRFLSHLDAMQLFVRAMKAEDLPIAYTRGRSPRPRISPGPALPTGFAGERELLDIFLSHPARSERILSLNAFLPEGFHILSAEPADPGAPALASLLAWGDYEAVFPATDPTPAALASRIARFEESVSMPVTLSRKGRAREVDIKQALRSPIISKENPATVSFLSRTLDSKGNSAPPAFLFAHTFSLDSETAAAIFFTRKRLLSEQFLPLSPGGSVTS